MSGLVLLLQMMMLETSSNNKEEQSSQEDKSQSLLNSTQFGSEDDTLTLQPSEFIDHSAAVTASELTEEDDASGSLMIDEEDLNSTGIDCIWPWIQHESVMCLLLIDLENGSLNESAQACQLLNGSLLYFSSQDEWDSLTSNFQVES